MAVDIKSGSYVYATGGDRRNYRPPAWLNGQMISPAEAFRVLGQQFGADRFYVADLDAIGGEPTTALPRYRGLDADMWLDLGIRSQEDWALATHTLRCPLILATETVSFRDWPDFVRLLRYDDVVSLDMRGGKVVFRDAHVDLGLLTQYMPLVHGNLRVLALDLDRVGSGQGPNWDLLDRLRGRHPRLWIGGGVHDTRDLEEAEAKGIEGAVVATALFTGAVTWPRRGTLGVTGEGRR